MLRLVLSAAAIICVIALYFPVANADSLGDRLLHTALSHSKFPSSKLEAQGSGWVSAGACVPGRGLPYVSLDGVTKSSPVILYFTQNYGFLSGFTYPSSLDLRRWDVSSANKAADMFWEKPTLNASCTAQQCSDLTAVFRDPATVCGTSTEAGIEKRMPPAYTIGDRLLIGTKKFNVPLNNTAATKAGWKEGNCIPHMGIHYSYMFDWKKRETEGTWTASTLFPVQPMYDAQTGHINAILVNNPHASLHVFPLGWWEGPFINYLFCKNWCKDSGCGFSDTNTWTTMHFFFRDPSPITCAGARCSL